MENILIDVAIPADRNVTQMEAEKKFKYKEFLYREITNVEHDVFEHTGKNWSHWNSNKICKEKFGSHARKTFNRFTTKGSYTRNITQNTEKYCSQKFEP
jgi:hypothetical protein